MTTLARLHTKGALDRQRRGRAYEYTVAGGAARIQSNLAAHQMLRLLDLEANRARVLARFVAELKSEDHQVLTELLGVRIEEPRPVAPRGRGGSVADHRAARIGPDAGRFAEGPPRAG